MTYRERKERERRRQADMACEGQDIGPPPRPKNRRRRTSAERSLKYFCERYLPARFPLKWSKDHLTVLKTMEHVVLSGGCYALAMPRGSGKTTIAEAAAIWAALLGRHQYLALIAATKGHAGNRLGSIKKELLNNPRLAEDWPEVCYPIREMGGISNRCRSQHIVGARTDMTWGKDLIVLPTVEGSQSSSVVIQCAGLMEAVRGLNYTRPDGRVERPTLAVIDDPQTRRSARSEVQSETRERILAGDVLYLPGPGKLISAMMPCTVIEHGDMVDRILDRKRNPEWQGLRCKALYEMPVNEKRWDEYTDIRREELINGDTEHKRSNAYYRKHRRSMDKGSVVAWPERRSPGELSALQHCMNLRIRDLASFEAEMQNAPLEDTTGKVETLDASEIAARVNGYERSVVPSECSKLTAFVDVQKDVLFWLVAAWTDQFSGFVLDYGTWPDQQRRYFTLQDLRATLGKRFRGAGLEGRIFGGLNACVGELADRTWLRDDGAEMRIDLGMVDANWGDSTETVYSWARQWSGGAWMPSHGKGIGASQKTIGEYKRQKGDRVGSNWMMPALRGRGRAVRYVVYDTNYWKTFVHQRLATAPGDRGSLTLYRSPASGHRLLADHLTAEFGVETQGRGRVLTEWKIRPHRPDNHWLDCLVGVAVAASVAGCSLPEATARRKPAAPRRKKRVRYMD